MSLATSLSTETTSRPSKARSKAPRAVQAQGDKPRKVSFYLSDDSLKRLGVHATMDGVDRSHLVEQLIQEGLRRYDLPRKRTSLVTEDRQTDSVA